MTNAELQNVKQTYDANIEKINFDNLITMIRNKIIQEAYAKRTSFFLPGIHLEGKKKMPFKIEEYGDADFTRSESADANFQNVLSTYYTRYTYKKLAPEIILAIKQIFVEIKVHRDIYDKGITFNWS